MNDANSTVAAGLMKRIMAIIYDLFLLAALLFIAEMLPVALNHGAAISRDNGLLVFYLLHPLYILLVCFLFFGWFWTHGGQTLGMKTWKLRIVSLDGKPVSWQQAGLRFVAALFSWTCGGLGFIWSLIDKDKRCWHDMASSTKLIKL
ncbi:MAG TPA: RDD family protein [Gammaproteobacteria bacterium]|nr:RDD family protein [Gammaproteobacteria bacterium]